MGIIETKSGVVTSQGAVVLGVFAPDGLLSCSGLATTRYDAEAAAVLFTAAFVLEHEERELHHTPTGGAQAFTWVVLRRR